MLAIALVIALVIALFAIIYWVKKKQSPNLLDRGQICTAHSQCVNHNCGIPFVDNKLRNLQEDKDLEKHCCLTGSNPMMIYGLTYCPPPPGGRLRIVNNAAGQNV
jgi:hypothetical protein